jgi:hypothetical protein
MAILDQIIAKPELIIATSAVVVSIVSIIVAVVSLRIQREHNILSVKPIAKIGFSDYTDYIAIVVTNVGMGPMIVKSIKTSDEKQGIIKDYPIDWMNRMLPGSAFTRFRKNLENTSILPSNSEFLLEYAYNPNDKGFVENCKTIRSILKDLTIRIEYWDIYGKIQPVYERELKWFGRTL